MYIKSCGKDARIEIGVAAGVEVLVQTFASEEQSEETVWREGNSLLVRCERGGEGD